jgi:hypothetical protein
MPFFSSIKSRGPIGQKGAKVKLTATGGQGTQTIGAYKYHTFTSNGTLTVIGTGPIEILAVGGGGGGGSQPGVGGGGGGGVIAYDSYICTSNLSITIGNGSGAGAIGSANGGSTTVTGTGISVTALGGGGQSRGTASGHREVRMETTVMLLDQVKLVNLFQTVGMLTQIQPRFHRCQV